MLTFEHLRHQNTYRCLNELHHVMESWSVAEWGNATAGECGEACNVAKKMLRLRDGLQNFSNKTYNDLRNELMDEIADTLIYLDLWAASQGINLEQAVRDKFNRDSEKRGLETRI